MKRLAIFPVLLLPSIALAQIQNGDPPQPPTSMPQTQMEVASPSPPMSAPQAEVAPQPIVPVDPSAYFNPHNPVLNRTQREALAISRRWREESTEGMAPVAGTEGAVLFHFGAQEPQVVCAVLQVCDIQLQAGEQINSVNIGDSARWLIEPAMSNSGPNETQHLIIKPMDVNLNTSLIVTTDRRTYYIHLVSHRTQFMPRVAFTYPDEAQARWASFREQVKAARNERSLSVPNEGSASRPEYLSNLNFNYRLDGHARWKPVRVYNDGIKTIIEMPSILPQTESPSLLIVRTGGNPSKTEDTSIVNYRLQNNRYIVDQIFDEAILIAGVGRHQERVTITRTGGQ